jgi:hypothetical protein
LEYISTGINPISVEREPSYSGPIRTDAPIKVGEEVSAANAKLMGLSSKKHINESLGSIAIILILTFVNDWKVGDASHK